MVRAPPTKRVDDSERRETVLHSLCLGRPVDFLVSRPARRRRFRPYGKRTFPKSCQIGCKKSNLKRIVRVVPTERFRSCLKLSRNRPDRLVQSHRASHISLLRAGVWKSDSRDAFSGRKSRVWRGFRIFCRDVTGHGAPAIGPRSMGSDARCGHPFAGWRERGGSNSIRWSSHKRGRPRRTLDLIGRGGAI